MHDTPLAKFRLIVQYVIEDGETPNRVLVFEKASVVSMERHEERVWLSTHITWCVNNSRAVEIRLPSNTELALYCRGKGLSFEDVEIPVTSATE